MQSEQFNILSLVKARIIRDGSYSIFRTDPCKGVCFVTDDTPYFIHGRMAVKGNGGGVYPDHYLDMIDALFGPEPNTIEVCSRTVQVDGKRTAATVDINSSFNPTFITDGQVLQGVEPGRFNRWRSDPPYREDTARTMYHTSLPSFIRLLEAGARVCKVGSLLFLLLGPQNYQHCPAGVMRVGLIYISVVPNNETRALNVFYKFAEADPDQVRLF
jgi:hypothetical protein